MTNLTQNDIDFIVEKTVAKLNQELSTGKLSLEEYRLETSRLNDWADHQCDLLEDVELLYEEA